MESRKVATGRLMKGAEKWRPATPPRGPLSRFDEAGVLEAGLGRGRVAGTWSGGVQLRFVAGEVDGVVEALLRRRSVDGLREGTVAGLVVGFHEPSCGSD